MLPVRRTDIPGPTLIDTISSNIRGRNRLPGKSGFNNVFKQSQRSADRFFTVLYCSNELGYPRLGLAIAKRNCRLAVQRNRLKRLIRESFRLARPLIGGVDIVVMSRPRAHIATNPDLFDSLQQHWRRLSKRRKTEQGNH